MKIDHDDYTLEGLADLRPIIWKILLENSRSIVQSLQWLGPKHANRTTKVYYFSPSFRSVPYHGRVGAPPSRLTANTS